MFGRRKGAFSMQPETVVQKVELKKKKKVSLFSKAFVELFASKPGIKTYSDENTSMFLTIKF